MKSYLLHVSLASLLTTSASARWAVAGFSQITENTTAAALAAYTGFPDSSPGGGDGGVAWGGMGNGRLVFDFASSSFLGQLMVDGEGIQNVSGADIVLFEAAAGAEESSLVKVEVSTNGTTWTDITSTRKLTVGSFPDLPFTAHPLGYAANYDISAHGPVARYLRLTGTSTSAPGQTAAAGNGYDLDAVARAVPNAPNWTGDAAIGGLSRLTHMETVVMADGSHICVRANEDPSGPPGISEWGLYRRRALGREGFDFVPPAPGENNFQIVEMDGLAVVGQSNGLFVCIHRNNELLLRHYNATLVPDGEWTYTLPAAYNSNDAAARKGRVAMALSPDGRPVILLAGLAQSSLLLQPNASGSGFAVRSFDAGRNVPVFGSGIDRFPALKIAPDGTARILLTNRSAGPITPGPATSVDTTVLMTAGFDSNGVIQTPSLTASSTLTLLNHTTTSSSTSFEYFDMDLDAAGRFAVIFRDRRDGRNAKILRQTGPTAFQQTEVPGSSEGGINSRIKMRGDGSVSFLYQVQDIEDEPTLIYGVFNSAQDLWDLSRVAADTGLGPVALTLTGNGCPLVAFPGVRANIPSGTTIVEARLPSDCSDFDNDGFTALAEEARLDEPWRGLNFILKSRSGRSYPELEFLFPAGGNFYGQNRYTTPSISYEVTGGSSMDGWTVLPLETAGPVVVPEGNNLRATFTGRYPTNLYPMQFFRIEVSRP